MNTGPSVAKLVAQGCHFCFLKAIFEIQIKILYEKKKTNNDKKNMIQKVK